MLAFIDAINNLAEYIFMQFISFENGIYVYVNNSLPNDVSKK